MLNFFFLIFYSECYIPLNFFFIFYLSITSYKIKFSQTQILIYLGRDLLSQQKLIDPNYKLSDEAKNGPTILTKYAYIVSYEHYTVVLPCDVANLPNDMHVNILILYEYV